MLQSREIFFFRDASMNEFLSMSLRQKPIVSLVQSQVVPLSMILSGEVKITN